MKNLRIYFFVLSLFHILSCSGGVIPTSDITNPDVIAIRSLLDKVMEVSRNGDLEGYLSQYTDDALWMRRDRMTDATKNDIRPAYKFMEDYFFDQKLIIDEVSVSGDIAYARITADGWIVPKPGKQLDKVRAVSRHIMILRKQSDGSWKFTRDIFINPTYK